MAIIQEIGFYQFKQTFKNANRSDNFSYQGLSVLFDSLEEYSESTGENVVLDVVALCCDYREESAESIAQDYNVDLSEFEDIEDKEEKQQALIGIVEEYLQENTLVCGSFTNNDKAGKETTTFIFQCF
jgi:hypothetical protein